MISSKFNIYKKYNDSEYWVYNTLTTAIILIENDDFEKFFLQKYFDMNNEKFRNLYEMGFFIDDKFDELAYLESLRKLVISSNKKIADIMIAPTMDCNARCYYCFEKNSHHKKMSLETANNVIHYLKKNWNHDLLNITWFGGEPLLAIDVIDYISEQLKQSNINFTSKVTTNGYYLTEDISKRAIKYWNTTKIQITIDALFEEYNKIKNYRDANEINPFEKVINNLRNALNLGIKVRVRINFNPLKKDVAINLMKYLQKKFRNYNNFSIYFAPIDDKNIPSVTGMFNKLKEHPFLSLIKFGQKYGYYSKNNRGKDGNFLYDSNGLLVALKLYPSPTNCYASCPCVFSIDSKGDLYKCHRILGKGSDYCSGNVKTGMLENKIYEFFCNTKLSFEECNTCKILPICQGGCKINAYIYKDNHACSPIKSIICDLIEIYLKEEMSC